MPISDENHQASSCPSGKPNSPNKSVNHSRAQPGESSSKSRSNHNFAPIQAVGTKAPDHVASKNSKGVKRKVKGQIREEMPEITLEQLEDDDCLLAKSMQLHNSHVVSPIEDYQVNQTSLPTSSPQFTSRDNQLMVSNLSSEMITIKKGVLWQQQDHDKFHQRLFSRWKKRFFILTTDYLVCFKRSTSKVGRSEMGKFLFKTSLGDILTVEWLRPKKSDKGAIILRTRNQFKLFLWTKDNLEDWMTQITAMRLKRKLRNGLADGLNHGKIRRVDNQNGIYENADLPALCDDRLVADPIAHGESSNGLQPEGHQSGGSERTNALPSELHNVLNEREVQVVNSASHSDQNSIERIALKDTGGTQARGDGPIANCGEGQPVGVEAGPGTRAHPVINDDRFLASERKLFGREAKSDDFVSDEQSARGLNPALDQSAESGAASKMQRSSSIRRDESHGHDREALESCPALATRRDCNDNLVSMNFEGPEGDSSKRLQDYGDRKFPYELREKQRELDRDPSQEGKYHLARSQESDASRNPHLDRAQMLSSIEVDEPPKRLKPGSNLIRRDESWHSMLSLNQFEANQDALRAHPASHGIPGTNMERFQRHSSITRHIESTVTPLRERPFVRQQSMQMNRNRMLPTIGQMQAASFDANHIQSSALIHGDSQPTPTSYHLQQKLLQLQLLHNSNADYAQSRNEQQIYGPGSIATTNHYGYYSMRSNLRSAASEFSFIRPGSSNLNPTLPQVAVAQPSNVTNNFPNIPLDRPQFGPEIRPQPMMTPDRKVLLQNQTALDPVNHLSQNGYGDLIAPSRDLPLKPNKKRLPVTKDSQKGSSSTIGSGIVQFFRRAFSRRHKQRPRLAESCSSSLGLPFDDKFESIQRARSAFSTTEGNRGSIRGELIDHQQQATVNQQHRMIDLIEAFANKTTIDRGAYDNLARQNPMGHHSSQISSPFRASMRNDISVPSQLVHYQQKPRNYLPQQVTGSPLHKSNSISTSTGLSGLNEMMRMNEHRVLVRESMSPSLMPMGGPRSSPLITRPTKVMSVNLTPVTSRREVSAKDMTGYFDRQPPRPSSIYGQPSMISSPMSNNGYDLRQDDFVSRRASSHQRPEHTSPSNAHLDVRRLHHQMKAPTLDTTREVAEEVSTPTNEFKPFPRDCANETNTNEITPMARNSAQQQRQRPSRIVNPILQSPTMNFIYDNHPAPRARNGLGSHYDNPRTLENQQSMSSMNLNGHTLERQQSQREASGEHVHQQRQSLYYCADVLSPRGQNYNLRQQQHTAVSRDPLNSLVTPSRSNVRLSHQSISLDASHQNPDRSMGTYTKPSKVVHPSTPTNNQRAHEVNVEFGQPNSSHTIMDHRQLASHSTSNQRSGLIMVEPMVWPSPIRATQHQHTQQHQRSPLVNRHTRVLKRNDGVQATFIEPEVSDTVTQLDLRNKCTIGSTEDRVPHGPQARYGSSTTASDSSASSSLRSTENQSNMNASKLPASLRARGSEASMNDGVKFDRQVMSNVNEHPLAQVAIRDDETSSRSASSGTDPISTSSSARSSSSVKRKGLIESDGKSSRSAKSKKDAGVNLARQPDKLSDNSRRSSSNEHSDENTSQTDVFNDHSSEDRKWVTSKLMQ